MVFLYICNVLKAFKYRIYPTIEQKEQLQKYFGVCRFAYNLGLETKIATYTAAKVNLSFFDLTKQMNVLKNDYEWISDCPAQAIQMSLRNLDNAYTKFFKGGGFPKFKNKYSKQSVQFPQNTTVNFEKRKIRLPKLKWVDCIFHCQFNGAIKTVTVSKTKTNKYFVSILVDNQAELPKKKLITEQTTVGIDLGIKTLAVLSDGTEFENPKWFRAAKANLRRQQRSLSRKQKDSNSREKQRLVVARCHEKIANQRADYLHKVTSNIINNHDTICLEDLNVKSMMKNEKLSLAIGEIGWATFKTMLEYKAEWYGKNIITIGRFEPSSKICSTCGTINKELKLQHREWTCQKCKTPHDRDKNAAINIKNFGLRYKPVQVNVVH